MKTWIVDSFTDQPFRGNPAGVCLLEDSLDDTTMLAIARELGLSETAFVGEPGADGRRRLRFWSPKMEIPLCGHATLAAAKVILTRGATDTVHFTNIQGLDLIARGSAAGITLEFPVYGTSPAEAPEPLLRALGLEAVEDARYNEETRILLLRIAEGRVLAGLTPDFRALVDAHHGINGVLVTAPSTDDDHDFHSRYFWPWSGIDEDPVTGGTHTFLAPYWAERLGKTKLRSYQCSARGGGMELEVVGETLRITARAVIVLEGELWL